MLLWKGDEKAKWMFSAWPVLVLNNFHNLVWELEIVASMTHKVDFKLDLCFEEAMNGEYVWIHMHKL